MRSGIRYVLQIRKVPINCRQGTFPVNSAQPVFVFIETKVTSSVDYIACSMISSFTLDCSSVFIIKIEHLELGIVLLPVLYWLKYYTLQILVTQLLRLTNMICFFV